MKKGNVIVECYGERKEYKRKDAIDFFIQAYFSSDGNEQRRYFNILKDLKSNKILCRDNEGDLK